MKSLSNYIQNLKFEYAVSYSGLREKEFESLEIENKKQIQKIEREIKIESSKDKSKLDEKVRRLSWEINIFKSRIVKSNGEFHKSTKAIHRFEKEGKEINQIFEILKTKFEKQYFWMCPPIFRDAIVFYSKEDEIVGILQMCFSCDWIKNENEEDFEVDHKIFQRLKNELIDFGHKID
ncbi:MAG: hypothetical protein ACPG49_03400 [Chitinophagales bacterium]